MTLDHLKRGLFGYKKADVCHFITILEEGHTKQLAALEEKSTAQEAAYIQRIDLLEQELLESRQRYEVQMQEQLQIASTLLDAKHYAEVLRNEAEEKERQERKIWEQQLDKKCQELDRYQEQINSLREMLRSLLYSMEEQTVTLIQKAQDVNSACPDRHMALFERNHAQNSNLQE